MQASIVVEILQNLTEASTILQQGMSTCKPEDWGKLSAIITIAEIKLRVHSGLYYLEIPIENDLPQTTGENIPLDTSTNP
jgi:hypothetical protein